MPTLLLIRLARSTTSQMLPFFVCAYGDTDPLHARGRFKKTVSLATRLDVQIVKETILALCSWSGFENNCCSSESECHDITRGYGSYEDKSSVLGILQTIQHCTAADQSVPTLMCTLRIAKSILKQFGIPTYGSSVWRICRTRVCFRACSSTDHTPSHGSVQQLNVQQFAKYMLFVKDIFRQIEEKRGATVTDTGFLEVKKFPSIDVRLEVVVAKAVSSIPSTARYNRSWDEDWVQSSSFTVPSIHGSSANLQKQTISSSSVSAMPKKKNGSSCPPVDVERPPRSSVSIPQTENFGMQNQSITSSPSLDEIDPFANWPPRSAALLMLQHLQLLGYYHQQMSATTVGHFTPQIL